MFTVSLHSAVATLFLSAIAVSAAPGLSLKVSGPTAVDTVADLKVVATLVNTGDEALKLLNDPRTPLSTLPENTFTISDSAGASPAFTGIKAKYVPATVIARNNPDSFTVLAPGESIEIEHDLSKAYNFTRSGEGAYTIEASNRFQYVDASGSVATIYADAEVHTAALAGTLAVARPSLSKRISYSSCSSSEKTALVSAAAAAQSYAAAAKSYLASNTASTARYTLWFGTFTTARHSTVLTHYTNMVANPYTGYTYDCSCTESDVYAYVYPDEHGTIYLCDVFWEVSTTGTDSQGGTLVHESSHFTNIGSTQDYVYGQSSCKSLATSSPAEAVENADSHEYFAENNPASS